jgi:prolyl oligopeptidase
MKPSRAIWILGFCAAISAASVVDAQRQALQYPPAKKGDVVDDYHGTKVPDPYRWMEDLDSQEVSTWVAAQNEVTNRYLANLPARGYFKERISVLWDYPKTTMPTVEAGTLFYRQNSGLQKQAPIFMRASMDAKPQLLIDPNTLWPDGATSLSTYAPSPDARYLAYTTAEGGADWQTVHVKDLRSGKDLPDAVQWMRFSGLSWTKDAKGFFYSRYPEPPKGKVLQAALSGQALYYHRIGTAQSEDRLIYERKDLPTWFVSGGLTEDGRYLLVSLSEGSSNSNRLYMADLGDPKQPTLTAPVKPIIETDGAEFSPIGNVGSVVYLRTDQQAPNRKVIAVDVLKPQPSEWNTIVPEGKETIESLALIGGRIVAEYLVDVQSRVSMFDLKGASLGDIALPSTGVLTGLGGREDSRRRSIRPRCSPTIRRQGNRHPSRPRNLPSTSASSRRNSCLRHPRTGPRCRSS